MKKKKKKKLQKHFSANMSESEAATAPETVQPPAAETANPGTSSSTAASAPAPAKEEIDKSHWVPDKECTSYQTHLPLQTHFPKSSYLITHSERVFFSPSPSGA
jgi:hypothetical protein